VKKKYIIGRHSANSHWDYYNDMSSSIKSFSTWEKHFIGNAINMATTFDTYDTAEKLIPYLGLGIFRIDTIYINSTI